MLTIIGARRRPFAAPVMVSAFLLAVFPGCDPLDDRVDLDEFAVRDPRRQARDVFFDSKVVALAVAAERGDVKTIDALLAQGVDVNALGMSDLTPLAWALIAKNKTGFERLLRSGANPNHRVGELIPLIHLAAKNVESDWLRLCMKYRGDPNIAVRSDDTFYGGQTPVFWALASDGFAEKLPLLLKAGANLYHRDAIGTTPLRYALQDKYLDSAYALLQAGVDFRVQSNGAPDMAEEVILTLLPIGLDHSSQDAVRDKLVDYLESRGADFSAAEASLAKTMPFAIPPWEEDKKRRAAQKKSAANQAGSSAPRPNAEAP